MPSLGSPLGNGEQSTLPLAPQNPPPDHEYPPPYVVEPTSSHTHTAILLHGLGSNGRAFGPFFLTGSVISTDKDSPFSRPLNVIYPSMKWVFPTASWRRSTRFKRIRLSSWFDVVSVQNPSYREETQVEGLIQSSQHLRRLIDAEVRALKEIRSEEEEVEKSIILGGLSQGCAMSLIMLLSLEYSLGGWVGVSGFMPMKGFFEDALVPDNSTGMDSIEFEDGGVAQNASRTQRSRADTCIGPAFRAVNDFRSHVLTLSELSPHKVTEILSTQIFYGHGSDDDKVYCRHGDELVELLRRLNMNVQHQIYQGLGHWIQTPEEINDLIAVFTKIGTWPNPVD